MVFFLNVWEMHWVSAQCFFSKANTNFVYKKIGKTSGHWTILFLNVGEYASSAYLMFFYWRLAKQIEKKSNNCIMIFLLNVGRNENCNCLMFFLRPHQKKKN
jgi:hypothetical protein